MFTAHLSLGQGFTFFWLSVVLDTAQASLKKARSALDRTHIRPFGYSQKTRFLGLPPGEGLALKPITAYTHLVNKKSSIQVRSK